MRQSSASNKAAVWDTNAQHASINSTEAIQNTDTRPGNASASLITELERLDSILLRKRWRSLMRTPAPRNLSRSLMIRILVWHEQVAVKGDLDKNALAMLRATLGQAKGGAAHTAPTGNQLRSGMVLVREHAGVLHRVAVLEVGFSWNDQTFGSLSAVARAITGINWNGPRFFGLDRPISKKSVRLKIGNGNNQSATEAVSAGTCSSDHAKTTP